MALQKEEKKYIKIFFLTGLPKSGTTWVMNMLNYINNVCCLGEGRFLSGGLNNVPTLYSSISQSLKPWYEYIAHRKQNWLQMDEYIISIENKNFIQENVLETNFNRHVSHIVRDFIVHLMERVASSNPSVNTIGDKTPILEPEDLERIVYTFPNAPIIYLKRNVRDFIVSLVFHHWRSTRTGRPDRNMPYLDTDDFLKAERFVNSQSKGNSLVKESTARRLTRLWCSTNAAARKLARQSPDKILLISYEKLVSDTYATMDCIYYFLGLTLNKSVRDEVVRNNSKEAILKCSNHALRAHIRSGEEGDWSKFLSKRVSKAISDEIDRSGYCSSFSEP